MKKIAKTTTICEETKHKAEWTNKPVTGKVCAGNEAEARTSVNADAIKKAIKKQASNEAGLECETAGGCPVGICKEEPAKVTNIRNRGNAYDIRDTGQQGECPDGKTLWTFRIRVDAKVEVQCNCPQPA